MVADPAETALTLPLASTVATAVLELLHVTFLLVAVVGFIVAVNVSLAPTVIDSVVLFNETPVTGIVTVTVHVAVLLPSAVVTVIVAVPPPFAVTVPLETVATEVFELLHVTFVLDAFEGVMVAVSVPVLLTPERVIVVLSRETPVTGIVTVTEHVTVLSPALAVMVAVPLPTAVTLPLASTVATEVLELDQVTLLSVAFSGSTVATSVEVPPTCNVIVDLSKEIEETAIVVG